MITAAEQQTGKELDVKLNREQLARFISKVNKSGPFPDQNNQHYKGLSCCWLWLGKPNEDGYGAFNLYTTENPISRNRRAHRISWSLRNGKLDKGLCVIHKCDNKLCVNPDHLVAGTKHENNTDRKVKDLGAKGEKNGSSKLTEDDVRAMRKRRSEGETLQKIADTYRVALSTVDRVCKRLKWAWVD